MNEGIPEFKTYSEKPITERKFLGGGRYGDVYRVKYKTAEPNPEKGKEGFRYFAEKKFKSFSESGSGLLGMLSHTTRATESAKKSVSVHSQLKELGVPTWTTYRLSRGSYPDKVLMSLGGTEEDAFLILPNNKKIDPGFESDHERLTKSKIDKIENLESVVNDFVDIFFNLKKLIKVSENDAVGIVYERDVSKIEVLFADLDSVSVVDPEQSNWDDDKKFFQRQNIDVLKYNIIGNIKKLVEEYMSDDNEERATYLKFLDEKMNEVEKRKAEFPQNPEEVEREKHERISEKIQSILNERLGISKQRGYTCNISGNIRELTFNSEEKFILRIFDNTDKPRSFGVEEMRAEMAGYYSWRDKVPKLEFLFTDEDEGHQFVVFKEE